MTIIAKPVIKEKFWILESNGTRVGMMNFNDGNYNVTINKKDIVLHNAEELRTYKIEFTSRDLMHGGQMTVMGYPTDKEDVYNVESIRDYPCFTKKPSSKSVHAAGWYGVKFKNGWIQSFCPRLSTVENYESVGPYKSQADLRVILQQKKVLIIED